MKITNFNNTVCNQKLIEGFLNMYNFYTLPHLKVKKPAKMNDTNVKNIASFIAKNVNLKDAVDFFKENAYQNGEVKMLAALCGNFSLNGLKTYHGVNVSKMIQNGYEAMFNNYVADEELDNFVTETFYKNGMINQGYAFEKNETTYSVPVMPSKPVVDMFEQFAEDFDDEVPTNVTPEVEIPEEETTNNQKPASNVNTNIPKDLVIRELQKIAEQTLSGYQLVLQQNAVDLLNQTLESKKNEIIENVTNIMLQNQLPATQVVINNVVMNEIPGELHHEKFETILKLVANGFNLYLYSGAGIGKTHLVTQVAKALKMPIYFMLPGNAIDLLGYEDAYGKFHETSFTKWAKNGGILYGSEFDANDSSLILNLNTALANGYTVINNETVTLHKNCRFIADGNSKMSGATSNYAGRQRQDASIIDRLMFVEMKNDYKLELALSGNNKEWISFIKLFRETKDAQGSNMVVSLRATESVLKAERILGTKAALEVALLKGANQQLIKAIADKIAIKLPQNKYAKALLEAC